MALSDEDRLRLEIRYELWGEDKVRAELSKPDREMFASGEVSDFASEWLAHKQYAHRTGQFRKLVLWAAGLAILAAFAVGLSG